jgi:hypothetical protein
MITDEDTIPTPTRAQAEKAVHALLNATNVGENLITRLKVAHYVGWRAHFDRMKDLHASVGIANAKVFYSIDSENTLVVLADIPDFKDALAWAQGEWRTAIPTDEVESPPVAYFGTQFNENSAGVKLAGHFTVYDYPKWHELFLRMEDSRVASGITNPDVFRSSEDGNDVLVLWDIADAAKARAWLVEDLMTGYPTETGAGNAIVRLFVELGPETRREAGRGN